MSEDIEAANRFRLERQAKLLSAFGSEERDLPAPPYHVRDVSMIYLLCRFDPDIARRILPPALELCDPCLGVILLFSAQGAWGIGSYSACAYGLQIRGHDTPDGFPANFVHCGFVTGKAVEAYNTHFNQRMRAGSVRLWRDGEFYCGEAGDEVRPALRVKARHTDRVGPELTGLNIYVGEITGNPTLFSVGYNACFRDLEDAEIEIADNAPESMLALKPLEVIWPMRIDGMSMTYSAPRSLSEPTPMVPQDTLRTSIFDLVSVIGRPAAIVTKSGRVLFANASAQDWLEGENRRLLASPAWVRRSAEQLDAEHSGETSPQPIPVDLSDGRRIFVQLLPMHAGLSDEPSVLVIMTDVDNPNRRDPANLLLMLGLTPAEARIAVRVGRGLSPAEAAAELGITENTARYTLQTVFEKLGIRRQSQLAQVVTRLEII